MSVGSTELTTGVGSTELTTGVGSTELTTGVGSTELTTGVGSPEPAKSGGAGFAGTGAEEERTRRLRRRGERE